jgi:hypothetical protein
MRFPSTVIPWSIGTLSIFHQNSKVTAWNAHKLNKQHWNNVWICGITTNFRLQLCIEMMPNQSFWYLNMALFVFQIISCRKTLCSLCILLKCWPNTSIKVLQSTVVSMIPRLRRMGPPNRERVSRRLCVCNSGPPNPWSGPAHTHEMFLPIPIMVQNIEKMGMDKLYSCPKKHNRNSFVIIKVIENERNFWISLFKTIWFQNSTA